MLEEKNCFDAFQELVKALFILELASPFFPYYKYFQILIKIFTFLFLLNFQFTTKTQFSKFPNCWAIGQGKGRLACCAAGGPRMLLGSIGHKRIGRETRP